MLLALAIQPVAPQNFFRIVGTLRDDTGKALSSVRIALEDENSQPLRTVFSDASGRFQFRGLRAGSYRIRIETTGLPYEPAIAPVDLLSMTNSSINRSTTEDVTPVDITLRRKKALSSSAPSVVFAQVIPLPAREEFNRGNQIIGRDSNAGIAALHKAIEIFPEYFEALELLGTQYVKIEQFDNAAPILERALVVNDKAVTSMYALGVAYLKLNRLNESIQWLEKSADLNSDSANTYMMLGLAYGHARNLDQAETALKNAYRIGGASAADAHLYLAGIYDKRGRFNEAWRELELYLKEARGLKNTSQIKEMIKRLKAKEKASQ
jgi:tetratricopeptide (TPR) repeat protein